MEHLRTGRWLRQGNAIVLDDSGLGGETGELPRPGLSFPGKPARPAGKPAAPPIPLFPPKPDERLVANDKMQRALDAAIAAAERARGLSPGTFPVPFTLVELKKLGPLPSAGYLETVTDYIASEGKVPVMYAAYALRDMVQRFATLRGALSLGDLLVRLAKEMNPAIAAASRNIARSLLQDEHRVPSYGKAFTATGIGKNLQVSFSPGLDQALEGMIVPGSDLHAMTCVHQVGYGYLNGALAAGGFFDPAAGRGLWIAGDYQKEKKWPYVRIPSRNDGMAAFAGTTRDMAKLVALIMTDRALDPKSCNEMRGRLNRAANTVFSWVETTGLFSPGTITHHKIGLGPLKSNKKVMSEVTVYQSAVAKGRRYVVAWQNLVEPVPINRFDVAKVIKATITEYER